MRIYLRQWPHRRLQIQQPQAHYYYYTSEIHGHYQHQDTNILTPQFTSTTLTTTRGEKGGGRWLSGFRVILGDRYRDFGGLNGFWDSVRGMIFGSEVGEGVTLGVDWIRIVTFGVWGVECRVKGGDGEGEGDKLFFGSFMVKVKLWYMTSYTDYSNKPVITTEQDWSFLEYMKTN